MVTGTSNDGNGAQDSLGPNRDKQGLFCDILHTAFWKATINRSSNSHQRAAV